MLFRRSATALAVSALTSVALAQEVEQPCPFKPTWNTCLGQDKPADPRIQCATIQVPKDYTSSDTATISLNLIRYAAVDGNNNIDNTAESIIINPGGPGGSGVEYVLNGGDSQAKRAGNKYHIIGFDPRGVGVNNAYSCNPKTTKKEPDSHDFTDPDVLQGVYEYNLEVAQLCNQQFPEYGQLIGTVADAHDVHTIAQLVGVNDKYIRYWGFSYGTLLGDTIARLYPKEIANMVLDGNINPNDFWLNQSPDEEASNIDAAIEHFFDLCAGATTAECAWKDTDSDTSETLLEKWDNWVGADYTQANRGRAANGISIDDSYYARRVMYIGIKDADLFPKCAQVLRDWYTGDYVFEWVSNLKKYTTKLKSKRDAPEQDDNGNYNPTGAGDVADDNQLTAITGADNSYRPANMDGATYGEWLQAYYRRSKYAGDLSIGNLWSYAPWIPRSKEYFDTPFAGIVTSPGQIIFIQTPYDPVTPDKSGKAAHAAFTNSLIVYTDGVGHCSDGQPSDTLIAAIKDYWTTDTTPTEGTKYALKNPNPFQVTPPATANEDIENNADNNNPQKRSLSDLLSMFDRRAIDPTPQTQDSCDAVTTTTTSASTSTTALTTTSGNSSFTATSTTGTFNISATYTGYTTSTSTSGSGSVKPTLTDTYSSWLQWSTNTLKTTAKPTASNMWGSWNPQSIPTVTTYSTPLIGVCETGLTTSTVTITATCAKGCSERPTGIPQGYTTTQIYCSACAVPSTVTVTVKATVTSSWSGWVDSATPVINTAKTVTWSAWPADGTGKIPADSSAKTTATGTWSAWGTNGVGKPVDASTQAAGSVSWSGWADASSKSTESAASVKSTEWANVPLATTASSASVSGSNWNAWSNPSATSGLVAKYTGGATSNAVARGGALVALAAAALLV